MLRVREIHSDTVRSVSVVESAKTWRGRTPLRCHVMCRIEPVAIIVRDLDGQRGYDVNAQPIDADRLARLLASPGGTNR